MPPPHAAIEVVGFDADDTLWHSEIYYQSAQSQLEEIVGRYVDVQDARVRERLLDTERVNVRLFGYGAKGMTLSMIESAIAMTDARITSADIHRIVEIGKAVLQHPVELLPGVREAVEAVTARHRVVLITKGDLFHQERKVAQSGLADLFQRIEIVSEKDERSYARLLEEFGVPAQSFAMVGNSVKSDILPVLALGGYGVHVPYHVIWGLEVVEYESTHPRMAAVEKACQIPEALERLASA
ncbi:MAG: HAD family hydrolase [Steroidobacteraceae bacterium]|jgi:putative hydrolase of the HAD superfamily|nr:HAD family hydrolase [Steroidobacteraceae bacterium]